MVLFLLKNDLRLWFLILFKKDPGVGSFLYSIN